MIKKMKQMTHKAYACHIRSRALNDLVNKVFMVWEMKHEGSPRHHDKFLRHLENTPVTHWGETLFEQLFPSHILTKPSPARHHTMIALTKKFDWFKHASYNVARDVRSDSVVCSGTESSRRKLMIEHILNNRGLLTSEITEGNTLDIEKMNFFDRMSLLESCVRIDVSGINNLEDVIVADSDRVKIMNLLLSQMSIK